MNKLSTQNPEVADRYKFMMDSVYDLGQLALRMIENNRVTVSIKKDSTKVTTVDTTLNTRFINDIENRFPGDLVWGEEESNSEKNNTDDANEDWLWLIDPIDGTSGFVRSYNNRHFKDNTSTIMVTGFAPGEKTPTMSAIYSPFQKQRMLISAVDGETWYQTSDSLEPMLVKVDPMYTPKTVDQVRRFEQTDWQGSVPNIDNIQQLMPHARLAQHQLFMGSIALGDVDLSVFPGPSNPHDVAPGALILHNAGGDVRTFEDKGFREVDWRKGPINGTIGAANSELTKDLIKRVLRQ